MSKYTDDKFINLIFKEGKTTRFGTNGLSQLDNLANYGGDAGGKYFVNRNGEYTGIVIELMEKVYPLYLSNSVHQIYLCVEKAYIGIGVLIERFGLEKLYQKYSNELPRFVVDEFLLSNNLKPIYLDYPIIRQNILNNEDKDLVELKKIIGYDTHQLIPVPIKVIGIGSLLPEDWIGKIFNSGKEFHQSIDLLDERIGKPQVTYLANYSMVKRVLIEPEFISTTIIENYKKILNTNIFILSSDRLKFNLGLEYLKPNIKYNFIEIVFDSNDINLNNIGLNDIGLNDIKNTNIKEQNMSNKILILFEQDKIMVSGDKIEKINTSIGFNVSLLQKSIRKGSSTINCLLESIENLSKARPFNNPEYSYEIVSGSRQLMWRIFITIVEETKIYKSDKYLDLLDFMIYSWIYSKYPNYFISSNLVQLVKITCSKIQALIKYWDFSPYKVSKLNSIPPYLVPDIKLRQFQLSLLIGIKLMPGMKGDKIMLESTIKWLETKPKLPELSELSELSELFENLELEKNKSNVLLEKINWFSSLDHHSNPNLITQLHNGLYGTKKYTLEEISELIWLSNSQYNYRKHNFKWNKLNDLIYLTQVLLNKNKSKIIDNVSYNINNYITSYKNISKELNLNNLFYLDAEINLTNNLIDYEKEKLYWDFEFGNILKNHEICEYTDGIEPMRIGQLILSSQFSNNFWYKGKKVIPIFTNTQLKFKTGDIIYDINSEKEEELMYKKIFEYYLSNYNLRIKLNSKIFNTKLFDVKVKTKSIYINDIECVKINTQIDKLKNQIEWIDNGLKKFLRDEKIFLSTIGSNFEFENKLKYIIDLNNTNPIQKFISYKSLCVSNRITNRTQIIKTRILEFIPMNIIKKIICRIETSIEDKDDRVILLLGKIDRNGKSSTEAVDNVDEGYLIRTINVLSCLFGCFEKISETKFVIHTNSKVYKYWFDKIKYIENNKIKTNNKIKANLKINQNQLNFIKTKLWKHQEDIRDMIISGINLWGQKGWGDASNVGSGKTLTGLSVIEGIVKLKIVKLYTNQNQNLNLNKIQFNFLILTPNINLYSVWLDEIKTHCMITKLNCWIQNSNGVWILNNFDTTGKENVMSNNMSNNISINIYISTMGRNRDNPLKENIEFLIIDECLTVQNNTSKWTMKAFEQATKSKYGVLMLSATFFRTRFDKLFFMLKMLQLKIPAKPEYLDTILNIAIGANIKKNQTKWIENIHKIKMDNYFYTQYSKHKKVNKKESYLELKKFMFEKVDWEKIIIEKTTELIRLERKVLIFVESENQLDKLIDLITNKKLNSEWSFYPDISNNICVISKHKGTYGINNLIKYDTILMKPPESDKLPQIKGRIDRPGQKSSKLFLEYILIEDTIDEIDLISLQIANNFYSSHIIPLATYYTKYA